MALTLYIPNYLKEIYKEKVSVFCYLGRRNLFHGRQLHVSCSQYYSLRWRHNERHGVSNHQPHHCLLKRLFRRRSKETSKLRVTGLCSGNSPVTGEFPAQRASNEKNVSIWWRHHGVDMFLPEYSRFSEEGKTLNTDLMHFPAVWHLVRHYGDVIMGAIASQITSLTIVYSNVYSDADQRKHRSSPSLAFVWGIHRGPGIPLRNGQYAENVSIRWRHHDLSGFSSLVARSVACHMFIKEGHQRSYNLQSRWGHPNSPQNIGPR